MGYPPWLQKLREVEHRWPRCTPQEAQPALRSSVSAAPLSTPCSDWTRMRLRYYIRREWHQTSRWTNIAMEKSWYRRCWKIKRVTHSLRRNAYTMKAFPRCYSSLPGSMRMIRTCVGCWSIKFNCWTCWEVADTVNLADPGGLSKLMA